MPNTPEKQAGMRIAPAPSLPRLRTPIPAAQGAAAPALLPPGVRSRFHGLRVIPVSGLSPTALQTNSGVVVLPTLAAPAPFRRATAGEPSVSGTGSIISEPRRVGCPRLSIRSLI